MTLFAAEVFIGKYVDDKIIRPYGGDFLVIMLIYCFVRSFLDISVLKCALGVLIFSFSIEILQYFNLVEKLGLGHIKLARIVIGTSFAWTDLLMYTLGTLTVVLLEYIIGNRVRQTRGKVEVL